MTVVHSTVYGHLPEGLPRPGVDLKLVSHELDLEAVPLSGGVLVKQLAISLDPYMRNLMYDPAEGESWAPPFELGQPLWSPTLGRVVRSESDQYKVGDVVSAWGDHSTYWLVPGEKLDRISRKIENKEGLPWQHFVGAAGMTGQTAFQGLATAKPQKGETIFVTAAAGAVGQIVGQLAKLAGLKVIGSAGDDHKVQFLREIGFDVAFNYKTTQTAAVLKEHPFDIFFDNVGGPVLDVALKLINQRGRVVACGAVSQYNLPEEDKYGVRNTGFVDTKQLTWKGFLLGDDKDEVERFYQQVPAQIARGEITVREAVTRRLDDGQAFVDMLTGKAQGKAVIVLE